MGLDRLAARLLFLAALAGFHVSLAQTALDRNFTGTVRPFVATYCVACHSGGSPAGGLDLRSYTTVAAVVRDYPRWNRVLEKLIAEEMPPKAMPQPPAGTRQVVIEWIKAVRAGEAQKHAGDPGVVLAHRLSNSEYNYTIRDLTGIDMQPTREFPVDPANTAGFDNSGESLTMSPALVGKYLQAAREVANHMVLTPDGISFAPYPMLVETDREKYAIERIVNFYASQPTDYADYFQAAWRYKHRGASGATLASIAVESKVSPKYLPLVWELLEGTDHNAGPLAKLRGMWHALPASGAKAADLRAKCVEMRDFVVRIRKDTAMEFAAPVVHGLSPTSQPLMNWKLRQFAAHRRDFDPKALRLASDPPLVVPPIPKYAGLGREAAVRAAALMLKSRASDPDLVVPDGQLPQYQAAFARLANVFPDAFYIRERGRFYPDDSEDKGRLLSAGYHNVMGYFRDDRPLMELILDNQGKKELNRLWLEFDFIADYSKRTWVQYYFNQSGEVLGNGRESGSIRPSDNEVSAAPVIFGLREQYLAKAAPSDNPVAMDAIRYHFQWVNDNLRSLEKVRAEAEPHHLDALLAFAARAYRRPLTDSEHKEMIAFYHSLRDKGDLTHDEAVRDSIVRILMSPKFFYLVDDGSGGTSAIEPLSGDSLASRLSYFLWSSMPDARLTSLAANGELSKPTVLAAEVRRMLQDSRSQALSVEFGGNWLDFRRFEEHNAVDRGRFPSFTNDLREAMFQEPVRMLDYVFRGDHSLLDLLYADYTFVDPVLARHYGMPEPSGGPDRWVRIDDAGRYGRGGLLPMSVFLTLNAPGLRTSPVKRGNWVVKRILGEVIPPPPPNVPELPADEAKLDLPLRDMLAKHRQNPVCAACHSRFDSFGLAFEGYGPVGELRTKDLAGHTVDARADFPGGVEGTGLEGLRSYIRARRQNDFVDNFSRKLLAYALGRSLVLSDDPLVERMDSLMAANGYRLEPLVEAIVTSKQFLYKRNDSLVAER
jgi:hypothetical protein